MLQQQSPHDIPSANVHDFIVFGPRTSVVSIIESRPSLFFFSPPYFEPSSSPRPLNGFKRMSQNPAIDFRRYLSEILIEG